MSISRLVFAAYDPLRDGEVRLLFQEYSHKDFQLQAMGIAKDRMAAFLETTLRGEGTLGICLRDNGELVGLIALEYLPWMSKHFGLRMYAVRHLLARADSPMIHTRLLRFVIEELPEVDFLDCRVAVDDIYSAHALEVCGFRYVGAEVFLGQALQPTPQVPLPPGISIRDCRAEDREEVLNIVGETHVHNRFVYDPIIREETTQFLYRKLVHHCFEADPFRVLVSRSERGVEGFIIYKMNRIFSRFVGVNCGSLDFIGVRPRTWNRGLGTALNRVALKDMAEAGVTMTAVRTLASNYPALKTCFRTGFQVTSTSLHFHRWIQRPKLSSLATPHGSVKNLKYAESLIPS